MILTRNLHDSGFEALGFPGRPASVTRRERLRFHLSSGVLRPPCDFGGHSHPHATLALVGHCLDGRVVKSQAIRCCQDIASRLA